MTDPIADMLTRVRNALALNKSEVLIPHSKLKLEIAKILMSKKFISSFEVCDLMYNVKSSSMRANRFNLKNVKKMKYIKLSLRYTTDGYPALTCLKRVSKPGRRIYANKEWYAKHLRPSVLAVISTSKGLMLSDEAVKSGMGGEVLCQLF